ncbi:sulfurtransferase [Tepidibacter aestuarii]|uniref:sulfurtransferase n=1 Tax=Tepidibacter aestuarii TaxID=2925782 RepID=UPI0020C04EF6|nr:sulfurtransferase [Tepidibacter aestuarii]CAH2214977.1 thiosulfate/3-mercaptopyruvate sulfurtransferase [Tepidibacter aestuarii]
MKKVYLVIVAILTVILAVGCTSNNVSDNNTEANTTEKYTNNDYIVEADWLNDNLNKEDILVLDTRSEEEYKKGHIPGAVNVSWTQFADMSGKPGDKGWGVVLKPEKLSEKLSEVGIDDKKTIVAYSDNKNGWGEDGRIVWMLRMANLENTKMLNGGWQYWNVKGYDVSKEEPTINKTDFKVESFDKSLNADTDWINDNLGKIKIVDSRDSSEYDGAVKYGEKRGGHLPGSINIVYTDLFKEDGRIKSQENLEKIFESAGIDKDDTVVSYCTGGIRSAYITMVFKMTGYENSMNYDASFYEWAGDESLPLEK